MTNGCGCGDECPCKEKVEPRVYVVFINSKAYRVKADKHELNKSYFDGLTLYLNDRVVGQFKDWSHWYVEQTVTI